jgi:hypothetical protein
MFLNKKLFFLILFASTLSQAQQNQPVSKIEELFGCWKTIILKPELYEQINPNLVQQSETFCFSSKGRAQILTSALGIADQSFGVFDMPTIYSYSLLQPGALVLQSTKNKELLVFGAEILKRETLLEDGSKISNDALTLSLRNPKNYNRYVWKYLSRDLKTKFTD